MHEYSWTEVGKVNQQASVYKELGKKKSATRNKKENYCNRFDVAENEDMKEKKID